MTDFDRIFKRTTGLAMRILGDKAADGHSPGITITPKQGDPVVIHAIFDEVPKTEDPAGPKGGDVSTSLPTLSTRLEDLPGAPVPGWRVRLADGRTLRVTDVQPQGHGLVKLILEDVG